MIMGSLSTFSAFLNQLLKSVAVNIGEIPDIGITAAYEISRPLSQEAEEANVGSHDPSVQVVLQKCQHVLMEKKMCPLLPFWATNG